MSTFCLLPQTPWHAHYPKKKIGIMFLALTMSHIILMQFFWQMTTCSTHQTNPILRRKILCNIEPSSHVDHNSEALLI